MISAADNCGQVVGGNYDVVITGDNDTAINNKPKKLHQQQFKQQTHQTQSREHHELQQPIQIVHQQADAQTNNLSHHHQHHNHPRTSAHPDLIQHQNQNKIETLNLNHHHKPPQQQPQPSQMQNSHQKSHNEPINVTQPAPLQQASRSSSSPSASSSAGSAAPHFGRALTNYLERFEQLELEFEQAIHAGQPTNCGYGNEFRLLKEFSRQLRQNKENLREGEMEINQIKNRYKDIIPFSHTRVSLLEDLNVPGSDYINANYIRGASGSPQAYIACQGPLSGTLTDFWRMIWECRVSVLVMACNEYESGKSKCEIYWPHELDSSAIFGPFEIRLLRVRQICQDFLVRKFSIKLLKPQSTTASTQQQQASTAPTQQQVSPQQQQVQTITTNNNNINNVSNECRTNGDTINFSSSQSTSNLNTTNQDSSNVVTNGNNNINSSLDTAETRVICQFHYTTWPDHGAPRSMQPILEMIRLMREVQPAEDRPILVHCSAGCGRTGTICCIDYVWGLLRRGELDPSFDLCSIISEMRQQRMAMVQTIEQYILCHRAVAALFIDQLKLIDDHTYENLDDLGPLDAVEAANKPSEPNNMANGDRHHMQSESDDDDHNLQQMEEDDNSVVTSDDDIGPVFI